MSNYTIYSDDSGSGNDQYHALTMVAVPTDVVVDLSAQLGDLIARCGVNHLEWKKITKRSVHLNAYKALMGTTSTIIDSYGVRVQTLIWNLHDRRHSVTRRDDLANKQCMYYKALLDVVKRYQMTDIQWIPDQDDHMDFERIAAAVSRKAFSTPRFESISTSKPESEPFLQYADVMAGLWRYYYENAADGREWYGAGQPNGCPSCSWTLGESNRWKLFSWFVADLKATGTPFERLNGYLKTPVYGRKHFNIWPYMPQHDHDRAPVKRRA